VLPFAALSSDPTAGTAAAPGQNHTQSQSPHGPGDDEEGYARERRASASKCKPVPDTDNEEEMDAVEQASHLQGGVKMELREGAEERLKEEGKVYLDTERLERGLISRERNRSRRRNREEGKRIRRMLRLRPRGTASMPGLRLYGAYSVRKISRL
jgi:hypothetical protein